MARIGELTRQIRGVSYSPDDLHDSLDDSSVILFRANNIRDGEINYDEVVYVDKKKVAKDQYLRKGDILICASSGSKELVGKAASINDDIPVTFGAFCKVVRPKDLGQADYLGQFFQSPAYRRKISESSAGANINNIRNEHIDSLDITLPSKDEQLRISTVLKKVALLISQRKKQLQKLDDLVKARFVEIFGDPEAGSCQFQTVRLGDLAIKISDGVHAKPEYTESGKPFLSVVNINKGVIDFTDCKFVSETAYQKMIRSTFPQKGDVLYTKVGATYGIPAYVDTDREFCLYVSVCLIKPNHEKINSRFLALQMAMPSIKRQADARIKGIGVPDLHLNQISEFSIICPQRELQDAFVCFAERVDKAKQLIQHSLEKLETLKQSLMQQYFGRKG